MSYLDAVIDSSLRKPLVVDLDLILVDPLNRTYFGNQNPTGPDAFTTSERIIIEDAPVGNYSLLIRSSKYPFNHSVQYSLVIKGGFNNTDFEKNPISNSIFLSQDNYFDCTDGSKGNCNCNSHTTGYICEYNVTDVNGTVNLTFQPKEIKFFKTNPMAKSYIYINATNLNASIHYCVSKKKFRRIADSGVTCNYTEGELLNFFSSRRELYFALYAVTSKPIETKIDFGILQTPTVETPKTPSPTFSIVNIGRISPFELMADVVCVIMLIIVIMRCLKKPPPNRSQKGRKYGLVVPIKTSGRALETDDQTLIVDKNPFYAEQAAYQNRDMQNVEIQSL
ncbi:hypothetical protein TVAG_331750 [Trichomonas vaginalis G3]|uniref:Uncharacterized protein n=2 Tax=Trichomonas vaginalis (strain ATCC PRA-98 / G3) TaxID=412133 RepID=A2GDU3_TRIV3|nr:hypothetical protein TVAG_331750 [Trichomonas vaginalis G3]|eukprot:XP_001297603.1 hypothetical protein [Trichomonas vaginalis G3]